MFKKNILFYYVLFFGPIKFFEQVSKISSSLQMSQNPKARNEQRYIKMYFKKRYKIPLRSLVVTPSRTATLTWWSALGTLVPRSRVIGGFNHGSPKA